jgi:hypothetical protein
MDVLVVAGTCDRCQAQPELVRGRHEHLAEGGTEAGFVRHLHLPEPAIEHLRRAREIACQLRAGRAIEAALPAAQPFPHPCEARLVFRLERCRLGGEPRELHVGIARGIGHAREFAQAAARLLAGGPPEPAAVSTKQRAQPADRDAKRVQTLVVIGDLRALHAAGRCRQLAAHQAAQNPLHGQLEQRRVPHQSRLQDRRAFA